MNANEINFAYRVRHALNENLERLPAPTVDRLAAARQAALSRKKPDSLRRVHLPRPAFAGATSGSFSFFSSGRLSWLARMGVALPIAFAIAGVIGIYQVEKQEHIRELAEIDSMVLVDELPLDAYLDHGFNAYLSNRGN
jgi:hypothetical protein